MRCQNLGKDLLTESEMQYGAQNCYKKREMKVLDRKEVTKGNFINNKDGK